MFWPSSRGGGGPIETPLKLFAKELFNVRNEKSLKKIFKMI